MMVGMTVVTEVLMVLTETVGQAGATLASVVVGKGGMMEPGPVGTGDPDETTTEAGVEVGWAAVTGQTVVETAMVSVTTVVDSAGQCETVSGHWVTVRVVVEKMVEVVMGMTDEVTTVERAGQLVTVGAHEVMVRYSVE